MRPRKEGIDRGAMTLVGCWDAAYGGQSGLGNCRLGYVLGLISSTLSGPCHIAQWASKSTRKLVRSSRGDEVYAISEMLGHMSMLRGFFGHFSDLFPGMVDFEDCDNIFTLL